MRKLSILSVAILLAGIFACNPMKKIETVQTSAFSAYEDGNFTEAYKLYEHLISMYKESGKEVPPDVIEKAGISAFESKEYAKAKEYLTEAFAGNKSYRLLMMLIDTYKNIGDTAGLKKLISDNIDILKKNNKNDFGYTELFKVNYATGNYEEAYEDYKNIKNPDIDLFPEYLDVLTNLQKTKEAEQACKDILVKDAGNIAALEWLAKSDYNKAENWYKSEISKYNKNKNATTYAYLRRDLKKISAIFRSARDKFEKLHAIDPENKSYIKYLKNCYLRLDMKSEAAKMDKLLK
ncbi:MAG: hypothetical protein GXO47_11260 [Chlorobi bacterium]|nr:hypothetical protein [Chlorobiota bacterium]